MSRVLHPPHTTWLCLEPKMGKPLTYDEIHQPAHFPVLMKLLIYQGPLTKLSGGACSN